MIIPEEIYQGERVKYFPTGAGNVSEGVVKRILTEPQPVGTRSNVPASEEDPRIVIENLKTRKETAYKVENIIGETNESSEAGDIEEEVLQRKDRLASLSPQKESIGHRLRGGHAKYHEGEHVKYHPTGASNVSKGEIKRIIRGLEIIGSGQTVHASKDDPRVVIENLRTHKETAYKPGNIIEKVED